MPALPSSPKLTQDSLLTPAHHNHHGNSSPQGSGVATPGVVATRSATCVSPSPEPTSPSALPRKAAALTRLLLNLQFLVSAAASATSGLPKTTALTPLTDEAQAVLSVVEQLGPATASQNPTPSTSDVSGASSLLAARAGSAHSGSTHSVRFLAAACRCMPSKAVFYLEQAATHGSAVASVELAICLLYGLGTKPDVPRALSLLDRGVGAGHPGAMFVAGKCLRDGLGMTGDLTNAVAWLQRAADLDYVPALHELGEMYEDGISPPAPIAEGGSNMAGVGTAPVKLWGLEKNLVLAMRFYKRAATLGYPPSQLNLAKLFLLATSVMETSEDTADAATSLGDLQLKAVYWLRKASDLGNQEARALLMRTASASTAAGAPAADSGALVQEGAAEPAGSPRANSACEESGEVPRSCCGGTIGARGRGKLLRASRGPATPSPPAAPNTTASPVRTQLAER